LLFLDGEEFGAGLLEAGALGSFRSFGEGGGIKQGWRGLFGRLLQAALGLEGFEFAEGAAVGGFEAELVAEVEVGLFFGLGMGKGVEPIGLVEQFRLEAGDAEEVPTGGEELFEEGFFEDALGLDGLAEFGGEGIEEGLVGGKDDVGIEPVLAGVLGRVGFALRGAWTGGEAGIGLIGGDAGIGRHGKEPPGSENKKQTARREGRAALL
jgi:hypothetical protein